MNSRKPAYKLVIVESPAKARTISKFLGRNYKVEASQGHVRDLPKSQLGVDVEHDFEPKYITIRGRGEVLERIRKEAKGAKSIILATDPDREGEAISWHLATILGIDPESECRVEFNEITEKTVKSAIKQPRAVDMQLVNAQQARRLLDRLVGYKISPLLWVKIKKGLSAGRVQSVATRMVVCLLYTSCAMMAILRRFSRIISKWKPFFLLICRFYVSGGECQPKRDAVSASSSPSLFSSAQRIDHSFSKRITSRSRASLARDEVLESFKSSMAFGDLVIQRTKR